jgi:uncharacterized protein YdaU (DUF1376 family)
MSAGKAREHLPWHRRFPKDMLHESTTMDVRDFGAYCIVLDLIYYHGGAVRDDALLISRYMGGCNARGWKNIRSRLIASGHIYQDSDTLRSPRADAELKAATRIREANAMGGHMSQALQRKAKQLAHPPDRSSVDHRSIIDQCLGISSADRWSKLKTKPAKDNDLAEVHSSYPLTQTHTQREEGKEAPSSSSENDAVAKEEKGLGEGQRASGAEPKPIVVSDQLARQIKSRWK